MCPYLININNIFQYSSLFTTVIAPSYRIQIIISISQQRRCIIAPRPTILVIFTQLLSIVAYLKNGIPIDPRATAAPSSELSCPPSPFFLLLLFSCSTTSTISSSSVVIIVVVLLIVVLFVMSLALSSTLVIASPLRCCWLL